MRNIDETLYWTPHGILTHNAMWNMVVGGRGTGKTFGSLRYCVKRYLKSGSKFIYLRRYETDLTKKEKLLSSVGLKFPDYEFNVEGEKIQVRPKVEGSDKPRWEIMGYVMALSTANSNKSIPFDDVDTIVYDEFILARGMQHYIRNEVDLFIDFYNTVDRFNDRVKVLMLANSVSIVNPYFLYFHVTARKRSDITKYRNGYIAVEFLHEKKFEDAVSKTRFGQLIADTEYYDYAVGNQFADDTDEFVEEKPGDASPFFNIVFDNETISVWRSLGEGLYYMHSRPIKDAPTYALTRADQTVNVMMMDSAKMQLKGLSKMAAYGNVRYTSARTRNLWYSIEDYFSLRR